MPLYDFSCPSCGETTEELVPAGTETIRCPECGAATERRLGTPSPLHKIGLRGVAAKRSDSFRAGREEQRREGWRRKREQ